VAKPETISGLFDQAISANPARPLLTFYDDATLERTELSGATLMNWVSKTANMIADDSGLGAGDVAALGLPPHWQAAAVRLGCWIAGLETVTGPAAADIAFVAVDQAAADGAADAWPATERYVLGLHPLALPLAAPPHGFLDFTSEVRTHGDHFHPRRAVRPDDLAIAGRTHAAVCQAAAAWASTRGLTGGRVLINADQHPDPEQWLIGPLAAGASTVLCRNLDPAKLDARAEAERVDLVIG
jgi:uncharacterized protein (TIGR03089 family)